MSIPSPNEPSPPPPPPPPPPEDPTSKFSPIVLKLRNTPEFISNTPPPTQPAPTGPYFLYGTLTDPSMISDILHLNQEPDLRPAYITGYACKLWGQYPALLDAPGSIVEGAVYHVQTVEDGEKLAAYETKHYHVDRCIIMYTDGKEPVKEYGSTFKFVGQKTDLTEGEFDLRVWLTRMGRYAAVEKLEAMKRIVVVVSE